jgi:polyhydroxybutyrate depolymerase
LTNPLRWNDGSAGPTGTSSTADDVKFLANVIVETSRRIPIDAQRIYFTGFSNGAGMVFRFAAEQSSRVAAIAPVAGYCWPPEPKLARPVPTLYMIGTADPLVPLRGGDVRSPWLHKFVRRPSGAATLERWALANGCGVVPHVESDDLKVRVERYPGAVAFRTMLIEGLGHHWPGGLGRLTERIGGKPSDTINATREIWRFFQRHTAAP